MYSYIRMTVAVVILLALGGCRSPQPPPSEAPPVAPRSGARPVTPPTTTPAGPTSTEEALAGKAVLMVLATENFTEEEFSEPKRILTKKGAQVTIASLRKGTCTGAGDLTVTAEIMPDQVTVDDYDAVVFVGGPGMIQHLDNQKLIDLAKKFYQADKLVAAIGVAPVILANAGLLEGGESAAVSANQRAALEAKGAIVTERGGVVSGARRYVGAGVIITASGPPHVAGMFGGAIATELQRSPAGEEPVVEEQSVRALFDKAVAAWPGRIHVPATMGLEDFVAEWGESDPMGSTDDELVLYTWGLAINEEGDLVRKDRPYDYLAMLLVYSDGLTVLRVETVDKDG